MTTDKAIRMIPAPLRLACLVELAAGQWAAKLAVRDGEGGLPCHEGRTPAEAVKAAVDAVRADLAETP